MRKRIYKFGAGTSPVLVLASWTAALMSACKEAGTSGNLEAPVVVATSGSTETGTVTSADLATTGLAGAGLAAAGLVEAGMEA